MYMKVFVCFYKTEIEEGLFAEAKHKLVCTVGIKRKAATQHFSVNPSFQLTVSTLHTVCCAFNQKPKTITSVLLVVYVLNRRIAHVIRI